MSDQPRAWVDQDAEGNLVLVDPDAVAVIRVVAEHNLANVVEAHAEHMLRFRTRALELGRTPQEVVIVLANVDQPLGQILADALMPGHDWQAYRDRGETPYARGLAEREGVMKFVKAVDPSVHIEEPSDFQIVAVDCGIVRVLR